MKKGMWGILIVLAVSFYIGIYWERLDAVRSAVGFVLDPTFGALIAWNTLLGFLLTVAVISLILNLAQKFFTDQKALKEHKSKIDTLRKELKDHKPGTDEYNKLSMEMLQVQFKEMMPLTMGSIAYTGVPIILFFRWFQEILDPIYGGWWFFYYIVATIVFSSIFRKVLKVA